MLPEAKKSDLLYVTNGDYGVLVYAYPRVRLVGTLSGFEGLDGLCADKAGDIFIPSAGLAEIFEYAHGGTSPIATLSDQDGEAHACSVDPTTGTLAVTNIDSLSGSGGGNIAIYAHASGNPKIYEDSDFKFYYFDAYDDKGNLFIEGYANPSGGGEFEFAELPAGSKAFKGIALDTIPELQNGLQWEGTYLAVGTGTDSGESSGDTYIYHVTVHGKIGKTIATTELNESGPTAGFVIEGSRVIVATGGEIGTTQYFHYPAGGAPTKTFGDGAPLGAVVSLAPK
jgi:hypothetical protein